MGLRPGPVSRVDKASSHPEVNQENQTALEPNNQILAAPANRCDDLPDELCSHLCRIDGSCQPGVEDLDRLESAADQLRLEARPHGLDFGQLGHGFRSLALRTGSACCSRNGSRPSALSL